MEFVFTDANFEKEALKSDKPVVVDFFAPWCGPCKMTAPAVEELAKEYEGKVKIGKMNIDENPQTPAKYGVMSIPTFLFMRDGKVVDTIVGGQSKDTLSGKLDALLT